MTAIVGDYLGAAHVLHARGLHVFPCDHPEQSVCIGRHDPALSPCDGIRGKHPAVKWGVWAVASTAQMIDREWIKHGGLANVGISCGPSNLVVLDEDAQGELDRWCKDNKITLPRTYTVATDRGRHLYFHWDHGVVHIGNCEKALKGYHINVRGDGGFVIGEGSKHESGADYIGNGAPIVDLPQEVADRLLAGAAPMSDSSVADFFARPQTGADPNLTMLADGERHNLLISYAGRLRNSGLDYYEAEAAFRARWLLCEQPEGEIAEAKFHTATCRWPVTWEQAKVKLVSVYSSYPAGNGQAPDVEDIPAEAPIGMAGRLLSASALANLPKPEPLIDNVLDQGTVVLLYGKWGTLKTFIALDWAASVATGRSWQGRPTEKRKALYVAAEGAFGYQARVAAWQKGWGITLPDDDFAIYPDAINLTRHMEVAALCALIKDYGYGIIVLDTLARCMVGADENSAKDGGIAIDALGRLRRCTPDGLGVVVGVHHTGKDAKTLRGSSAFEGGADTVYFTSLDGAVVELTREKRRDGPRLDLHKLRLDSVPGTDSGTLSSVSAAVYASDNPDRLMSVFVRHFATTGASKAELRLVSEMAPSTFHRAVNQLVKDGALINVGTDKVPFYKAP